MPDKVSFDGNNKLITVLPGVTSLDIRTDVYSRWVDWNALPGNSIYWEAFRRTGFDTIPGGVTGDSYFLINGWKLIIDFRITRVTGILYSDDFETPYYTNLLEALYPAKVSSLVNIVLTGGSTLSAADVWNYADRTLSSTGLAGIVLALQSDFDAIPDAMTIALAVRAELTAELAKLDATISSRHAANVMISANVKQINDVAVTGSGVSGDEWGPA